MKRLFKETERAPGGDVGDKHQRIRCPACGWQPQRGDRWMCKCHHVWNTFDTRGVCPACGYRWLETQCLSCNVMSLHEAWYASE